MPRKEEGEYPLGLLKIVTDINLSLPPQLFDRRAKMVHETERDFWRYLSKECMSDESDNEDGGKTRHSPKWRSDRLNLYIHKLDERNSKKLGNRLTHCVTH
jgi:hypothetical protein